jgi:formylglycine-generating enzyme required for sulfatase activity
MLISGGIDIALVRPPEVQDHRLEFLFLFNETPVVAFPERHVFARQSRVSIDDLANQPLIVAERRSRPHSHDLTIRLFAEAQLEPHIVQYAEEKQTIVTLGAEDIGVAIVPRWTSRISSRGVCYVPLDVSGDYRLPLAIAWPRGARDSASRYTGRSDDRCSWQRIWFLPLDTTSNVSLSAASGHRGSKDGAHRSPSVARLTTDHPRIATGLPRLVSDDCRSTRRLGTSISSHCSQPAAGGSKFANHGSRRPIHVPNAPTAVLALPAMMALPGGTFAMGSNDDPSERPVHRVTVKPFALSKFPITNRQWRQCVAVKACEYVPDGNDDAPVANVSWNDAQQFVEWISKVTQRAYRLPSEAEWEYAARGGTQTKYWWGDQFKSDMANCKGCATAYDSPQPAKVGSFKSNPFGLHDLGGNVDQWVDDCWHRDYQGAPTDGSAWIDRNCASHVIRSGSWKNDNSYVRPASRDHYDTGVRYPTHGLRVASPP